MEERAIVLTKRRNHVDSSCGKCTSFQRRYGWTSTTAPPDTTRVILRSKNTAYPGGPESTSHPISYTVDLPERSLKAVKQNIVTSLMLMGLLAEY